MVSQRDSKFREDLSRFLQQVKEAFLRQPYCYLALSLAVIAVSAVDLVEIIPVFSSLTASRVFSYAHESHDLLALMLALWAGYRFAPAMGVWAMSLFLIVHVPYVVVDIAIEPEEAMRIFILGLAGLLGLILESKLVHAREEGEQRLEAERALREVLRRSIAAQERENSSAARQLNEEVGQLLTGLGMLLDRVGRLPPEERQATVKDAEHLVAQLIGQVRSMAFQLRPSTIDDLGLVHTLLLYFEHFTDRTKIAVNFRHDELPTDLPANVCMGIYRIVQEALSNVANHSGVKEATVSLWTQDNHLFAQIVDHGKGFELASVRRQGGLNGMKERSGLLGGKLSVDSAPKQGTYILAEIPLDKASLRDRHCPKYVSNALKSLGRSTPRDQETISK